MKVTVNTNLNVRVGKPSLNAPCYQYLAPGSVLEIDGKLYKGDSYDGIDTWYKDEAGNYYWSGGVNKNLEPIIGYPDWMLKLKIPEIWEYSTGKNVGVAVIDTGIDSNNDELPYNEKKYFVFDEKVSLQDTHGHGTHCAGLIGARNKKGNIIGVAPNCNLFVCKIAEGGNLKESDTIRYADAINWCANQDEIHVISISWGSFIDDVRIIAKLQGAINLAAQKNKIVVCAMGDASQFNDPGPLYPVSLANTIGIGSIPVDDFLYPYINPYLLTSISGASIPSYGIGNRVIKMSGTSQSNAIVSGLISLIIEKENFKKKLKDIEKILLDSSITLIYQGVAMKILKGELLLEYFSH
ncbi:MAG: S8/S53 family peptidase [Salinivirgaceae bacterium]|nr:S8/S53 family peptidase [Salinivirgaceae bacterium]